MRYGRMRTYFFSSTFTHRLAAGSCQRTTPVGVAISDLGVSASNLRHLSFFYGCKHPQASLSQTRNEAVCVYLPLHPPITISNTLHEFRGYVRNQAAQAMRNFCFSGDYLGRHQSCVVLIWRDSEMWGSSGFWSLSFWIWNSNLQFDKVNVFLI